MSSHETESTQNLGLNGAAPHAAADDIEPHSAISLEATEIIHPDGQAPEEAEMPEKVTLETLAAKPIWVAWQVEDRPDGKPTKVPYAPDGRKARANAPKTWGTREAAEAMARRLLKPYGLGGVGIEFSTLPAGTSLAGIDLDTCRDPATGAIDSWAQTVIQRFDSYTEVSPSGTGAKIFFAYPTEALPNLRAVMGGAAFGKQFKRGNGKDHPPAIELHLGNRYFAVTGDRLPSSPVAFRTVATDTLLRLLTVDGPAFAGTEQADEEEAEDPDKPPKKPRKKKDRSSTAFRNGAALRRQGKTFEEMVVALAADPETADWVREKGQAAGQRELHRIWDKAGEQANAIAQVMAEFNKRYLVVNEAGKAVVYAPGYDAALRRRRFDRHELADLRALYMNRQIEVGVDKEGAPITKSAANVWLTNPDRRQFIHGITFDPSGAEPDDGVLNLWQGFAFEPVQGDWSLLRQHIGRVVCCGDPTRFHYLMGWMARMIQRPAEQGEVAVVMRGGEGTGKGTVAKALLRLMGQHGMAISNTKHLVGNFNGHLRDAVLLFADEAFFAGDKAHVGTLKSLITEPYLTVEAKFQNAVQTPNRLHLILASNEEWVVPASLDARRFFVLEVSEDRKGDHDYFAAIQQQMDAGGYAAMLYDLLHMDLTTFNVRAVPVTDGLVEQRKLSLPVPEAWWRDCLERGYVFRSRLGLEEVFAKWHRLISTELLFTSYTEFAKSMGERHPLNREGLGKFMRRMCAVPKRFRNLAVGEHTTEFVNNYGDTRRKTEPVMHPHPSGFDLGEMETARADFLQITGLTIIWDHPDT